LTRQDTSSIRKKGMKLVHTLFFCAGGPRFATFRRCRAELNQNAFLFFVTNITDFK